MDNAMRGRWSPASDKDYFKWKAPSDGVYFLAVNSTPTVPTHTLTVFEQTGISQVDQTPRLRVLNRGHNSDELDPVGLTFNATKNVNYYFELYPDPSVESDWYKLTLQKLDDYGATCSGAAMLNLGFVNPTSNMMDNLISSQLLPGDQDCFHIQPAIEGSYTLALPQSPDSISPLVELFSYNPNAFDFANEARTQLGQFAFPSGNGQNGEYTIELRHSSVQGLNYQVQGLTYQFPGFTPNVGYCACISTGTPGGDSGQQDGSGQNGSSGDTNTNVTCCDGGTLMGRENISYGMIETPGNQDYFKRDSLYEGLQYEVFLKAVDCSMPLRVDVIENGVVKASGETTSATCEVHFNFTPNGTMICLRVSAVDSTASSDVDYNLEFNLNAK
jgi:hypothetical protein